MSWPGRVADVMTVVPDARSDDQSRLLERLSETSVRGLAKMYEPRSLSFPRTLREGAGIRPLVAEGMSVRYAAIAALGLSRLDEPTRRTVLGGRDAHELLPGILGLALAGRDQGAIALSAWAAVEVASATAPDGALAEQDRLARALDRLSGTVPTAMSAPTVEHAWTLVALLAALRSGEAMELAGGAEQLVEAAHRAARLLLASQGPSGLFPHVLPADRLGRFRSHVGCFADQAYSIQALARYAAATGDEARSRPPPGAPTGSSPSRAARVSGGGTTTGGTGGSSSATRCTACTSTPWPPWPYGAARGRRARPPRSGRGGPRLAAERPETDAELVADDLGVVWRKVGRHEPRKMVRRLRSAASAGAPERQVRWLDRLCPPGAVDRECRPFELGWLLYAWHAEQQADRQAEGAGAVHRIVLVPDSVPAGAGDRS